MRRLIPTLACLLTAALPAAARGDLSLTFSGAEIRELPSPGFARTTALFAVGARIDTRTEFLRSGAQADLGYFRNRPAYSGGFDIALYRTFFAHRLELAAGPGIGYNGLARLAGSGGQAMYIHRYSPFLNLQARLLSGLHSGVDLLIGSDVAWRARVGYSVASFD